jgi:probable O-glycosylation ligase (exosortase A-associated)
VTAPIARRGRVFPAPPHSVEGASTETRDRPLLAGIEWTPAYAAFLVYIFTIITYRMPPNTGTVTMAVALLTLPLEKRPLRLPPVVFWTIGLLAWAMIGWTTTDYPDIVWDRLIEFSKIVGVILVAVNVLTTRPRLRFFLLAFLGYFALYPVRGALITYFTGGATGGRAAWNYAYQNPNDLAGMCLLVFSLSVGMLVTDRRLWIRACALAGAIVLPLVILLTQSRGAFIALLALAGVVVKGYWRQARMLLWGGLAVVFLAFVAPDSVWQRLGTLKDVTNEESAAQASDEGSARQRLEIWKVAATIFAENPMTGVGLGAYSKEHYIVSQRPVFNPTALGARDTHSTYLNLLAETGLPGLLFFFTVIGATILDAERVRRRAKAVQPAASRQLFYLELGLFGYLVAGIWGSYGQLVLTYLHLALIYATAQVLKGELAPAVSPLPRRGGGAREPRATVRMAPTAAQAAPAAIRRRRR